MKNKNLKYYMTLPYTISLKPDEEGDYIARIEELDGCIAHGGTAEEALALLSEVKQLWIEDALERSEPVPEPRVEEDLPSGKWVQRVPRLLHKRLIQAAKRDGVSLNLFVSLALAELLGMKEAVRERARVRRDSPVWGQGNVSAVAWIIEQKPATSQIPLHAALKSVGRGIPTGASDLSGWRFLAEREEEHDFANR